MRNIQIAQLSQARLLVRTNNPEKLDGPPTYRCSVGYSAALALAKSLDIVLADLMWEAV
jgi:origin recognition complex subunit 5